MSLLIKGMEMPNKCISCRLMRRCGENDLDFVCMPARVYVEDLCNAYKPRPDWCTLVSVPPHGDLVDRAALWVEINKICDRRDAGIISDLTCLQQILSALRHAPTIIPAEPAEEGQ